MESPVITSLLGQLDEDIDDLEDSLAPLLDTALSATLSKLPLLDKAKLYVLVTYAIESMLFSFLRLNDVKAREHPVFKELTRVRQYFRKIKDAETPSTEQPVASLDKKAAARFIKAGLVDNDGHDSKRARYQENKTVRLHTKFGDLPKSSKNITSSSSVAIDNSEPSGADLHGARIRITKGGSKKRKADAVDGSVPALSITHDGSSSESPSSKCRKSQEDKDLEDN